MASDGQCPLFELTVGLVYHSNSLLFKVAGVSGGFFLLGGLDGECVVLRAWIMVV